MWPRLHIVCSDIRKDVLRVSVAYMDYFRRISVLVSKQRRRATTVWAYLTEAIRILNPTAKMEPKGLFCSKTDCHHDHPLSSAKTEDMGCVMGSRVRSLLSCLLSQQIACCMLHKRPESHDMTLNLYLLRMHINTIFRKVTNKFPSSR